ncbi:MULTISPECIES: arsinothricin resistance N-acetyltransferase ArsN1 family B [Salinibaculum]|uniref:arsinothricin resistance N-acetyltransferase ArsN1 family B n=1 Tax=Salinibaculum TaxID=2732368 RepID=UPI0030D2B41D
MAEIRLASPADATACREIYAPYVAETTITFESSTPTEREFRERVATTLETYPWLVCEHEGRVVGYAYASRHRKRDAYQWAVEASVYVDDGFHRHGIARGLYESLFAVLDLQGFYDVYAGTTLPNDPSVSLHRSMGFESVGVYPNAGYKLGDWRDVEWWHRQLRPHDDDPAPPTPLGDLETTDALAAAVSTGEAELSL